MGSVLLSSGAGHFEAELTGGVLILVVGIPLLIGGLIGVAVLCLGVLPPSCFSGACEMLLSLDRCLLLFQPAAQPVVLFSLPWMECWTLISGTIRLYEDPLSSL